MVVPIGTAKSMFAKAAFFAILLSITTVDVANADALTPPMVNLARGRRITASSTCGVGVNEPELFCQLTGANTDTWEDAGYNLIQGQVCDYCSPNSHPGEFAIDGTERWWQSPPLSRGMSYNEVNLTVDLGQLFHVAFVIVKMGNSPRPGVWVLERSVDNGQTFQPWQYFAETQGDCVYYFGEDSLRPISRDDAYNCDTEFSKIVPLDGGEIVVELLKDRPSRNYFFNSTVLQKWTQATTVRFRFLRAQTLSGHLMSMQRHDPTVTRRYFYSIKDIIIGGRCVCNGHALQCDTPDPADPYKLLCNCLHNTAGARCELCQDNFVQKAWRQRTASQPFVCEPCNCHGHSEECMYDPDVDAKKLSIDIHGNYEGGGVCKNCRDNTKGINCHECADGYFRPYGVPLNSTYVCQRCNCDVFYSTGNCMEGSGKCECRPEYQEPDCASCSEGYYDYPNCKPCDCFANGTNGPVCEVGGGQCPCKENFAGQNCDKCADGYYNFPECLPCECNSLGSTSGTCDPITGQCECTNNFGGRQCDECDNGFYGYPDCQFCNCDAVGTTSEICNKETSECICREGFGGARCDQCVPGFFGYPNCQECQCSDRGSISTVCDSRGQCRCLASFAGRTCDRCSPGYYKYPECVPCNCAPPGSIGVSCDDEGRCECKSNFFGQQCDSCSEGFYNYPLCEECNCDPAGILASFGGCGTLPVGELCECKERVTGRICNTCKPLYWNLNLYNPLGCEDCNCNSTGVLGGFRECESASGQCICKPLVTGRTCDTCKDGSYMLSADSLFGCVDCNCDIGGAVGTVCDKTTGMCACQPRISGRRCDKPLNIHYVPTLHQFQYEIEDGYTPQQSAVRFRYEDALFPEYSWKGYAVFSQLQKEILYDVEVMKSTLYRVILRYVNRGTNTVMADVALKPESPLHQEQSYAVRLEPSREPTFVTVSGAAGNLPSPYVLNPGRWTVSVKTDNDVFVDYFVLLPLDYYEGTKLQKQVNSPCTIDHEDGERCVEFAYPDVTDFASVEAGKASNADLLDDETVLEKLNTKPLALLTEDQTSLQMDLNVPYAAKYVVVVEYHSPEDAPSVSLPLQVEIDAGEAEKARGRLRLEPCRFNTLCRQAIADEDGRVGHFDLEPNAATLKIENPSGGKAALASVVVIPVERWDKGYILPKKKCLAIDGKCVEGRFASIPGSTRIEVENGNEDKIANVKPEDIQDNSAGLVYLVQDDPILKITGKVPYPGYYAIIVHYYQPQHPDFKVQTVVESAGQTVQGVLPLEHCPSTLGCRAYVRDDVTGEKQFQLYDTINVTLKDPGHKAAWIDYIIAVPMDSFSENVLAEQPVDLAGDFIAQCGQNHFHADEMSSEFCKKGIFSLTADYNNGALPCQCDFQGAISFECNPFGGQCQCRENVIGRKCERCKTGFFGFPNCKACDCPSTSLCDPITGACICPPRVTGERCGNCEPQTYGFDPIVGCEDCNCNPRGVANLNLQCDLETGQCECKENVVGRTCSSCVAGYWRFPECQLCNCDYRGTMEDICDQGTSSCFCKPNVGGGMCDVCKPGTFNLEEMNPDGCTKCFCFGKTDQCSSSSLYWTQLTSSDGWGISAFQFVGGSSQQVPSSSRVQLSVFGEELIVSLDGTDSESHSVYFAVPEEFIGDRLASYGGHVSFQIKYEPSGADSPSKTTTPDLIIRGGNTSLIYFSMNMPSDGEYSEENVRLTEMNFRQPSGSPATREQFLLLLHSLEGVYIKATPYTDTPAASLTKFSMDYASDEYFEGDEPATAVEKCACPPSYEGNSCERCAPGHYRAAAGPYGGYCIPCQCNGHTNECDQLTGKCLNCQHNTKGDHCEECIAGYHGDATVGTPYDCLICACPLPLPSNNFADACQVSPDGLSIKCECKPGYIGPRCEACAAGFFGRPEVAGDYCKPCECNNNINPNDPASCDSVSGECLRCLNNTGGEACALCAPGYFGDAVVMKNCVGCSCEACGTKQCNSYTGECQCLSNVIGQKCDTCAPNHWGFESCEGCEACNCGPASESTQCEWTTGQCRCKHGVTGRQCDQCEPGFWNYGEKGCERCLCNPQFAFGGGCNPNTGQCECLKGVVGQNCDRCPHRWVLIKNVGCEPCDSCLDGLLDETDQLAQTLEPIMADFNEASKGYFTRTRLSNLDSRTRDLQDAVQDFDGSRKDMSPWKTMVEEIESEFADLGAAANDTKTKAFDVELQDLDNSAVAVKNEADKAAYRVFEVVGHVSKLAEDQIAGPGPAVDQALALGEEILKRLEETDLKFLNERLEEERNNANLLYSEMEMYPTPFTEQGSRYDALVGHARMLDTKLLDLFNQSSQSILLAQEANEILNRISGEAKANFDIAVLMASNEEIVEGAKKNLTSAATVLKDAEDAYEDLDEENKSLNDAVADLKERLESLESLPGAEIIAGSRIKSRELNLEVARFERESANSQVSSSDALRAANAYRYIIAKTSDAENASSNAVSQAQLAKEKSEGVDSRAQIAKENSYNELNFVQDNTTKALSMLSDSTSNANNALVLVENVVNEITKELDDIMRYFDSDGNLKSPNVDLTPAAEKAEAAHAVAKGTLEKIDEIYDDIPEKRERAKNALIDYGDGGKVKELINNRLSHIDSVAPKLRDDVEKLTTRQATLRVYGEDLAQKIKELKENIKLARNKANDIRVGVSFHENTVVQARPPSNIHEAATTTKISLYMNATTAQAKDGFLIYVGHPADTHRLLKNVDSDDFMALELRQGKVTLIADFGSGPNILTNNNRDVVDGQWHRIIAERIGKKLSLKIIDEGEEGTEMVDEVTTVAMGTKSALNLDRDHSVVFVGGFPIDSKIQQAVLYRTFDGGEIEDVTINDMPVGLWNFRHTMGRLEGAIERNKLRKLQRPTGLRFDGEGYAKVNRPEFRYVDRFNIKLDFKTTAREGIIFLAGNKKKKFTSIELREGRILYQFNLGSIPVQIISEQELNDGQWHTLEAARQEGNGKLTIDGVPVPSDGGLGRQKVKFSLPQYLYFGGYQGTHDFPDVSQVGFSGCIDNVVIGDGTAVDLSANVASIGVSPGCPDKTARMVSFDGALSGYVKMLDKTRPGHMQLTLKFKTIGQNGQLFYSASDDNKEFTSLALRDGRLIMQTQDDKVETDASMSLNDKNWHYLTATVADDGLLHLHIDDLTTYSNTDGDSTDTADKFDTSRGRDPSGAGVRTFFGGLPETVVLPSAASISDQPFIGCVADATINGEQVNFAESSASHGEQLDKCPILDVAKGETLAPAVPVFPERFNIPVDRPMTQAPPTTTLTTPRPPNVTPSRSEDEEYDYPTGTSDDVTSTPRTRLPPPDISNKCTLPVQPEIDAEVNEDSGYRFGNSKDSRMEFQTGIDLKRNSKFSVSFKTTNPEGVLFYVSDKSHTDKIALFMKDGRLHFVFNCGTGPAVIKDPSRTDNGQWHTVEIIREAKKGTLVVDGIIVAEGESMGHTESINVEAPYYIGGMPEPVAAKAKKALAAQEIGSSVSKGFAGCLKDFTIEGLPMKNPVRAIGVLPCSDKVEPGVFVTAEGGYVIADPKFKVGQKLKLQMEIKPRTNDGILVAVHGSSAKDYLVLQLIDGVLTLVVDNGAGRFNCSLKLDDSMSLCDGNWHNILVVKILNLATLAIDGISGQAGVGKHGVFVTNTEDPLYIGGHPNPVGLPGILTTNQYVGCIRKLSVNGVNMNLSEGDANGKVYLNSCPTI